MEGIRAARTGTILIPTAHDNDRKGGKNDIVQKDESVLVEVGGIEAVIEKEPEHGKGPDNILSGIH